MASNTVQNADAKLKVVFINVKGLNLQEKCSKPLAHARSLGADILLIQEMHFRSDCTAKLANLSYPIALHATNKQAKTEGVSILISKCLRLQIADSLIDDNGQYLFIKGVLWDRPITLANIYSPKMAQVWYFRFIAKTLSAFKSGILFLGGDLNAALNPLEDTSTGTSSIPF